MAIGPRDLFDAAWQPWKNAMRPIRSFPLAHRCAPKTGGSIRLQHRGGLLSEGWCAEATMLGHYVMGGRGRITEICVVAEKMSKCTPCGGCRQRLAEFARPDAKLYLCDETGIIEATTLGAIFPRGFDGETLK